MSDVIELSEHAARIFTWDVRDESWEWGSERGSARHAWSQAAIPHPHNRYVYRLEFYQDGDRKAATVYKYLENAEGQRFLTWCPKGEHHAAMQRPFTLQLDEFPPEGLWYPSA